MATLYAEPNDILSAPRKSYYNDPRSTENQEQIQRQSSSQLKKRLFYVSAPMKHEIQSGSSNGIDIHSLMNNYNNATSNDLLSADVSSHPPNPDRYKNQSRLRQSKKEIRNFSVKERKANHQNESQKLAKEENEMKNFLNILELRGMEIQGQVRILTQERDHFHMMYEETRRELNRTREELTTCEESYSRSYSRIQHLLKIAEDDKEIILSEMHRQSTECDELRKQVTTLNSRLKEVDQTIPALQDHISHLNHEKEQLQRCADQNQVTKSVLHEKVDHLTSEVTEQRERIAKLEQEYLDEQRKYQELVIMHERKLCEEEELMATLHRLKDENIHLEEHVKENIYQWTHVRQALNEKEKSVEYLSDQIQSREMQFKVYESKLTSLSEENRKLQNELTHSHATTRHLDVELSAFQAETSSLQSRNEDLMNNVQRQSDAMKQTESELLHLLSKYNALQEEMKNCLNESKHLRANLDSIQMSLQVTEKELSDTQVALRGAEEENIQFRNTQSSMQSQISSLQSQITDLTIQLQECEVDKTDLLRGLRDLRFVCSQLDEMKVDLLTQLRTKEMQIDQFRAEVEELHENISHIRTDLDHEESNKRNLQAILDTSREKENLSREDMLSMQREIQCLQENVSALTETLDKSKQQVDSLREKNHQLEIELQCLQRDYSNEKFEKLQLQSELRIQSLVAPEELHRDTCGKKQSSRGFV